MKILSLFDGISGCQLALNRLGIPIDEYYASEIDTYAMTITQVRFPKTIQLGDVSKIDFTQFKDIDLLAGGSPCFEEDTFVYTSDGYKCIKDIKVGDYVLTHANRYCKVLRTGHKIATTYCLCFKDCLPVRVTANHPYLIYNEDIRWKPVSELKQGDYAIKPSAAFDVTCEQVPSLALQMNSSQLYYEYEGICDGQPNRVVYNLEVEHDNSYTANNLIVHNCQDLSITNHNRKCLEGERSGLFYKYVEALDTVKPKYFLLENVASMPDSSRDAITELMGVEPIMIDSALVCSQQRKRYYWTNLPVEQPEDRHVCVEDIIDYSYLEPCSRVDYVMKPDLTERSDRMERLGQFGKGGQGLRIYSTKGKGNCLGTGGANNEKYLIHSPKGDIIRQLTTLECERQQTLPDYYTRVPGVPDRERRKAIGNGWTIDVIAHIFKSLKGEENGIRAVERET